MYPLLPQPRRDPPPRRASTELPVVTMQLPLFNEMYVARAPARRGRRDRLPARQARDPGARRLDRRDAARSAAPRSTSWRPPASTSSYIHRDDRTGFKAGALENGLHDRDAASTCMVFDADFLPPPTSSSSTVHHFTDAKVGMVQVRWDHVNRDYSLLTELQAMMLDGHFVIEHTARHRSGRFFNFNGTAGIWRRAAIERRGRLAARHADRGHGPVVPRAAARLAVHLSQGRGRRRPSCRWR